MSDVRFSTRGMALLTVVSDARTCSSGNRRPVLAGQDEERGEMNTLSGRPKTMVALALALVFLLTGCPKGEAAIRAAVATASPADRPRLTAQHPEPRGGRHARAGCSDAVTCMRVTLLRHGPGP